MYWSLTKAGQGWSIQMGLQRRFGLAVPGAGHLCGKQLPGAKQACRAPLDHLGRHVAWRARRAKEIRHNRLRDFLVEYATTVICLLHVASTSLLCIEHCTIQTARATSRQKGVCLALLVHAGIRVRCCLQTC